MMTVMNNVTVTTKFGYATFEWNNEEYAVKISSAGNLLWKRFTNRHKYNGYGNRPVSVTSWRRIDLLSSKDSKFRAGLDACVAVLNSEG